MTTAKICFQDNGDHTALPLSYFICKDGSVHTKPKRFKESDRIAGLSEKLSFLITLSARQTIRRMPAESATKFAWLPKNEAIGKIWAETESDILSKLFSLLSAPIKINKFYPAKTNEDMFGSIDLPNAELDMLENWVIQNMEAFLNNDGLYIEISKAIDVNEFNKKYIKKSLRKGSCKGKSLEVKLW